MAIRKLQIKRGQGIITIPKDIWTTKGWTDKTPLEFKFGPKGELIISAVKSLRKGK